MSDEPIIEEQVENEFDLSDIEFEQISLDDWLIRLTIEIPPLPCTSFEITNTIISLNNKYQLAYNCLSKLLVLTNRAEKKFKYETDKAVSKKLSEYAEKNITKTPTLEKLELIVINSDSKLKDLYELYSLYSLITEFFSNQKNKLERVYSLVEKISYYTNNNDKIYNKAKYNEGV